MSEDLKRTYALDFFTKLEIAPTGTVNVFGTMQDEQLTNYEARLSVMDMTVFIATNAAVATKPIAEVALMFMRKFSEPVDGSSGLSATQKKWYATGAAARYFQMLEDSTSLQGYELKTTTQ